MNLPETFILSMLNPYNWPKRNNSTIQNPRESFRQKMIKTKIYMKPKIYMVLEHIKNKLSCVTVNYHKIKLKFTLMFVLWVLPYTLKFQYYFLVKGVCLEVH